LSDARKIVFKKGWRFLYNSILENQITKGNADA